MTAIVFLIYGLVIFTVLLVLKKVLQVFSRQRTWIKELSRFFPSLEMVVWLLFTLWAINGLFKSYFFYPVLTIGIILVFLLLLSWFLFKDFVAGAIFKTQNEFKVNQRIKLNNNAGKIIELGFTSIKIETKKGEVVKIPYSKLTNEAITKQGNVESADNFRVKISTSNTVEKDKTIEEIKSMVLNSPWASVTKSPVISNITEDGERYIFEVMLHALNPKHAAILEKGLKDQLAATNP